MGEEPVALHRKFGTPYDVRHDARHDVLPGTGRQMRDGQRCRIWTSYLSLGLSRKAHSAPCARRPTHRKMASMLGPNARLRGSR